MTEKNNYFLSEKDLEFIPSGCKLLDLVLGGGYPLGRIVNIVGDASTGKTLLAIEAFINFKKNYPDGKMYYHESEAAFDIGYAEELGMPVDSVEFIEDVKTVEDFYSSIEKIIKQHKEEKVHGLYVLDSLDALSDRAELERGITDSSYAMTKQKKLSEIFRRIVVDIEDTKICLMIISQVRDNIGVVFGERYKRSGGKALDFYASQVLWLAEIEKLYKTVKKIKRPIGIMIKAKCKKNKISLPFRECVFPIIFGYGIDDAYASLNFLTDVGVFDDFCKETGVSTPKNLLNADLNESEKAKLDDFVSKTWSSIEENFVIKRRKYT